MASNMAAGLFSSVVSMGKAAIQRIQGPVDPNVVRPVNPSDYLHAPTQDRQDGLIFYGPIGRKNAKEGENYDIVVLAEKSHQAFW